MGNGVTEREVEILMAVAEADSGEEAAAKVGVTPDVVRKTTMRLRRKLGVQTNLQALVKLTGGVRFVTTKTTTTDVRLERLDD